MKKVFILFLTVILCIPNVTLTVFAEEVDTTLIELEKNVQEAAKALEDAQSVVDMGSLGFFDYVGNKRASEIIKYRIKTQSSDDFGTTNLGEEYDATDLNMMKYSIQAIREVNEWRLNDNPNLFPYMITHSSMAVSQVKANMSAKAFRHVMEIGRGCDYDSDCEFYLRQFGENLGFDKLTKVQTWEDYMERNYIGFFYQEKVLYEFLQQNPTYTVKEAAEYLIENGYPHLWLAYRKDLSQCPTGHYKSLVNPTYNIVGVAINSASSKPKGCIAINPATKWTITNPNDIYGEAYAVDEYEEIFMGYYNVVMGNLNAAKQNLQTAQDVLQQYKDKLEQERLEKEENQKKADEVILQIDSLPSGIDLSHKSIINSARISYNNLTDKQKELVTNYDRLVFAENKIKEIEDQIERERSEKERLDKEAASYVDTLIENLPIEIKIEHKEELENARNCYDLLTDVQKSYVVNLDKLQQAEQDLRLAIEFERLAQLEEEERRRVEEENKRLALEVDTLINDIPENVTFAYKITLENVRNAYDKLTLVQKSLVKNYQKLENAEVKMVAIVKNVQTFKGKSTLNLKASAAGKHQVKLAWSPVSDAEGYLIYGIRGNNPYCYIGITGNLSFTDTKALGENWNFYWVFPYKYIDGVMITGRCEKYVFAKGIQTPVTNFKSYSTKNGVKLTWSPKKGAVGYLIYGILPGQKYKYIGMTSNTQFTHRMAPSTNWSFYWVYPYYIENGRMIAGQPTKYVWGKLIK